MVTGEDPGAGPGRLPEDGAVQKGEETIMGTSEVFLGQLDGSAGVSLTI